MKHKWKKIWKPLFTGCVFAILIFTGVRAYQNGDVFKPSDSNQDILQNRVVFQNKDDKQNNLKDSSGNSDLWEKDKKQEQKIDKNQMPDSQALFEQMKKSKSSGQKNYVDTTKGTKVSVNVDENASGNSKGKIKIQKEGEVGNPIPTAAGGENGTKTGENQGDGGGAGTGTNPQRTAPTATPDDGSGKNDGGNTKPTQKPANTTATPRPTPAPKAPERPPSIPKGDSLIESIYPSITEFPAEGVSDSNGTLSLFVCPIFDADRTEYVYYNAELTADKLLCSVIVYVQDQNNRVLYRLTRFNDNFQIGDFPSTAKDDFTVTFRFRQNSSSLWKDTKYSFTVLPYKYFVLNEKNELIGEETPESGKINLLSYYKELLTKEQQKILETNQEYPLSEIVTRWKDANSTEFVSDQYVAKEKGWKSFIPAGKVSLSDGYEAKLKWYLNLDDFDYCANLKYLQTLTKIPAGTKQLNVAQGIHWVDLPGITLQRLNLSESTAVVSLDDMVVKESFSVAKGNPYFSVEDEMLLDKEKTNLLGIPSGKQEISVPKTVTKIQIPKENSIKKMEFTAAEVPEIDFSNFKNTLLWVPDAYYDTYYAKWADKLPDSVQLLKENGSDSDFVLKNGAFFSKDGIVLYRVLDTVKGNYVVPDGVRVIKENAFAACDDLYRITLPASVEDFEENSLSAKKLRKIIYLGDNLPLHADGKFTKDDVTVLVKQEVYSQWKEDERPQGLKASSLSLAKENGFVYLEEGGKIILLDVPEKTTRITTESFGSQSVDVIASGAFSDCKNLFVCEFSDSVKEVEIGAFIDCERLQGILWNAKDTFTIQKGAYDNCPKIRFVAYNAMKAVFEDDYKPRVTAFSPKGSIGYPVWQEIPYGTHQLPYGSRFFMEGSVNNGVYLYSDFVFGDEEGSYLVSATDNVSGELNLRSDIWEIVFYAFENCKNTFTIDFTKYNNLFAIDECTFKNSGLSGEITLPDTVRELQIQAFSGCKNITSVQIQSSALYKIPMYTFSGCTSLKSVTLPKDSEVKEIGIYAFAQTALESFTLPLKVETLYDNIFSGCANLKCLYAYGETPAALVISKQDTTYTFGTNMNQSFHIEVLPECEAVYKEKWKAVSELITVFQSNRR